MESNKKRVYCFGGKTAEGNGTMRELLGGKGANLAEMTKIGLPVPQGFTVTTEACTQYYEDGRKINDDIQAEIEKKPEINASAAIIVVDGKAGIEVGTEIAWNLATSAGIPKAFFINRFDDNDVQ